MRKGLVIAGILSALVIGSCGRSAPKASYEPPASQAELDRLVMADKGVRAGESMDMLHAATSPVAGAPAEAGKPASGTPGGLAVLAASKPDRYLIKNATLVIETEDARVATNQLTAALAQVDGYVSDLRETVNGLGRRTVVMQVRIPSDRFDQSMLQVETLGKVLSKQVNTQDVTEQYVDTDARVRNLKRTEERLLDHLNRAGVLEEVLRVEQELSRVREEIERMEGQLRFLSDRVAFSTITITLQEAAKTEPLVPAESFSTGKVASEAVRSLVVLIQAIWVRVIWVAIWSVVWLPLALVLRFAYRRYRRQNAR